VSVAASVARFAVAGFLVTLALGAVSGVIAERAGAAQVTRSFQRFADVIADTVVAPQVTSDLLHGDPSAQEALRTTVTRLVNRGRVVHVRVWDWTGRTVWADDPELIGRTVRLPGDLQKALAGQSSVVSSDGGRPSTGSSATADPGNLLTVYAGVQNDDATPLLVALSERYRDMQTTAKRDWMRFGAASLGALLLLELLQIPFAWSLVRRLRRHQAEAEAALLQTAADAAEITRRRITSEVHDHVIQDLTGLTYDLDAARLRGRPRNADDAFLLDRTASCVRRGIADLRSLVVGLAPTRPPAGDLTRALEQLAERLGEPGTQGKGRTTEDLPGPPGEGTTPRTERGGRDEGDR
jgi:two-component system NarL family sensor kinase